MYHNVSNKSLLLSCTCALLLGCASEPAPTPVAEPKQIISGEQMMQESKGIANLSSRWQKGKKMVEDGNKLKQEGQLKIDSGNQMIDEGQKIMEESELHYKNMK